MFAFTCFGGKKQVLNLFLISVKASLKISSDRGVISVVKFVSKLIIYQFTDNNSNSCSTLRSKCTTLFYYLSNYLFNYLFRRRL